MKKLIDALAARAEKLATQCRCGHELRIHCSGRDMCASCPCQRFVKGS